jgi:nitrite reductase (NO-forming)
MHIASGMFGAILVEPPEGLPKVDHEFYVAQSEFYTRHALAGQGPAAEKAAPSRGRYEFSFEKMLDERPDYVLWNGRIGSLTNQNALQVRAGERVRLFVVNGGLNLTSSFHVIGGFLDQVWEGALDQPPLRGVATRAVPAGGAIVVDTRLDAPGAYFLVDHALSRSFNKGCVGVINVTGEPRADLLRFLAKRPLDDAPAAAALPALAASKPAGGSYHKLTGARAGSDLAALGRCAACHDLSPVGKRFYGPPLFGVYGRKPSIDGVPFPRWDQAALDAWLKAPNRIKPDTSMTFHVGDEIKRAEIIEALEQLK